MAVQYAKLDHTPTVVFTPGKSWESFLKTRSTIILVPFDFVIIFSRKSKKLTHRSVGNIISFEPVVATTILAESFGQVQTTFCAQTKVCPKCWKPPNKNAIFESLNHRFIKPGLLSLSCQVLPMHNFFVLQNICWLTSVLFCHLRKHWTEIIPLTTLTPYVSGVKSISFLLLVLMSCLIQKGGEAQT